MSSIHVAAKLSLAKFQYSSLCSLAGWMGPCPFAYSKDTMTHGICAYTGLKPDLASDYLKALLMCELQGTLIPICNVICRSLNVKTYAYFPHEYIYASTTTSK